MKSLSIILVIALAGAPVAASAGRGFDMSDDVSAGRGSNGAAAYNRNTGNAATYNKNTGTATTYNRSTNTATQYNKNTNTSTTYHGNSNTSTYHPPNTYNSTYHPPNSGAYNGYNSAGAYNKNTGNAAVYNKNTGTSSTYHYNNTGKNGYYYNGRVVVNPVYVGPAWGWNRGVVWAPVPGYWGGGFWGPYATAALMGSIVYANQRYTSYYVNSGSPGATLLSNYGLRQVPCGPPGLVVIYGPNFGVICANPNGRVGPGNYAVNVNNLTLQSQ
jgi:hypothetical protein